MSKKPAAQTPAAPPPSAERPTTPPAKPPRPPTVLITDGADIQMERKGTLK